MKFVIAVVYMCIGSICAKDNSYKVERSKCGTYIKIQNYANQNGYVKISCK